MQRSKYSQILYFGNEVSSERKINDESNARIQNIYTFYQITKQILYNREIRK
jgi:adenylate cyclase class IV